MSRRSTLPDNTPMEVLDQIEAEQRTMLPRWWENDRSMPGEGRRRDAIEGWEARPHPIKTIRSTKRWKGQGWMT